jgi:hypothetical protein
VSRTARARSKGSPRHHDPRDHPNLFRRDLRHRISVVTERWKMNDKLFANIVKLAGVTGGMSRKEMQNRMQKIIDEKVKSGELVKVGDGWRLSDAHSPFYEGDHEIPTTKQ